MVEILNGDDYEVVKTNLKPKLQKKLNNMLKGLWEAGEINKIGYDRLRATYSATPQMYGLPKIHKLEVPLRPIVSSIDSPTYGIFDKNVNCLRCSMGTGVLIYVYGHTPYEYRCSILKVRAQIGLTQHGHRYGDGCSMHVSSATKRRDCQHLWQRTLTYLLPSRFYCQPKTHSERRARRKRSWGRYSKPLW